MMSEESDPLACLLELVVDVIVPDLSATTYHTLAQNLPNQVHDRVLSKKGTGILHKQLAQ